MPEITTSVSPRLFYRKTGSGPAVILLHGFPETSEIWQNISRELSEIYTLIMPDFPGSGNSSLNGAANIGDMAECVKAIMEHEQIEKAVVAGHSMGGYVGFELASRYPQCVMGLSLIHSSPAADDEDKKNTRRKAIELIKKGGKKVFIVQMMAHLFASSFIDAHPQTVNDIIAGALAIGDTALINFYEAMIARKDHTDMLRQAAFPIQWIAGKEDNIIPYGKILELGHKSNINFISLYAGCGHMSMIEAHKKLIPDLKKFINFSNNGPNNLV